VAITTITHEIDLFDSLVAVGIQLTADTAFTGAQRPLHNGDVTAFATFLARARQLSPHWNGSFTTHMHLAVALVKAMTSRLNLPAEDQFLTSFQILAHDVGRLLTHRVVTNEVRGRELLRAMNFVSPFDDIHFGWSYWTGDIFSPSMRHHRDRIVVLADQFGKPSECGPHVRTIDEAFSSVRSLTTRYAGNHDPEFLSNASKAQERCTLAIEASLEWLHSEGVDFDDVRNAASGACQHLF